MFIERLIDLVFISNGRCPLCSRVLFFTDEYICDSCKRILEYIEGSRCKKCGNSIDENKNYCSDCISNDYSYECGYSMLNYLGSSRELIYEIKFNNNPDLAVYMGGILGEKLYNCPWISSVDLIIPVPLHENRYLSRGYNQSEKISEGVVGALSQLGNFKVSLDTTSLIRHKDTPHQLSLDRYSRYENVKDAFKLTNEEAIKGKEILLIDDVYTTGATIAECSDTLLKYGADKVYYAVLASGTIRKTKISN